MVVEATRSVVDGKLLKWMLAAGVSWLEYHKQQVNNMNVFPVPDGDTGTNMVLTVRKAYQQIAHLDEEHIGNLSKQIARGALTGARGNSGTILSMLLRGFSQALDGKEVMDAEAFAHACQSAVDYAYDTVRSVMEPVEGTILTVAREAAAAIRERALVENDLKVLLSEMIAAARESLSNTPNLLPKLKEAGVVDSGGMGLVYILEGMKRLIDGETVHYGESQTTHADGSAAWEEALVPDDEEGYGYDVQFLMLGNDLDVAQVRQDISAMGWSPLVDGDEQMIKVHIHVHNPGEPLTYAIQQGAELDDIVVENMQAQYLEYVRERSGRESVQTTVVDGVAIITVARGSGLEHIFDEYGAARVIIGGQTMNPSTEDFISAIESLPNDEIIILPNNGNVIMAAQQAAALAVDKDVRVVPSKTIQQGIAALISYMDARDDNLPVDQVEAGMRDALTTVISAEVTYATRNATIDGVKVREGQYIGLIDGKLKTAGDALEQVILDLLHTVDMDEHELVTIYYGEGCTETDAAALINRLSEAFSDTIYEAVNGGQPLYPYLFSIE